MEKSFRHDKVIAHSVTFLKIVSQNAPDCISVHIHFKKFPGVLVAGPPRKLVAFGQSGLLSQKKILNRTLMSHDLSVQMAYLLDILSTSPHYFCRK